MGFSGLIVYKEAELITNYHKRTTESLEFKDSGPANWKTSSKKQLV